MISGCRDQAIWNIFTTIFILQILIFDLIFGLSAEDLKILCCSYFQVVFENKPVLLLNYSNRYCCRTTKSVEGSELWHQWAEMDVALLMAPSWIQPPDLPKPTLRLSPKLIQLQHNIAHKADEVLLPQKWAHFLFQTTFLLPGITPDASFFLPALFHYDLTSWCLTILSLLLWFPGKAIG